ncbi:MAG TPA: hypothetical protein VNT60_07280 [Deinococcales bacterium]|nr:hypothetical protein [Deinococcales bacterium]
MEAPAGWSSELEERLESALQPIRAELAALRAEVERLRAASPAPAAPQADHGAPQADVAPAEGAPPATGPAVQAPPAVPDLPVAAPVPPERSDFARMLQRGLEQEARESPSEERDEAPGKRRRGWSPFRR